MNPRVIVCVMIGVLGAASFGLCVPQAWAVGGGSCTTGSWVDQGCGAGGCSQYRMHQTRTVTPAGCTNDSQCVNHSSCCSCTGWVGQGCGVGGCSAVQRNDTRTCTPSGCLSESRCVNDTACGYTPPLASGTWAPYGFVMPGDPDYGFPAVETSPGVPLYKDPNLQDLVGFAAKGNVILGNYTSGSFQAYVVPNIDGGASAKTRPYVIDPTDADMGYDNYAPDGQGRPRFGGNYTLQDEDGMNNPGLKLDGTPRKFYESTLPDAEIQLLCTPQSQGGTAPNEDKSWIAIDGVLFTNHLLAGAVTSSLGMDIRGSVVARDESLVVVTGNEFGVDHDLRLLDNSSIPNVGLPLSVQRPQLIAWQECRPASCP